MIIFFPSEALNEFNQLTLHHYFLITAAYRNNTLHFSQLTFFTISQICLATELLVLQAISNTAELHYIPVPQTQLIIHAFFHIFLAHTFRVANSPFKGTCPLH